MTEETKTKGKGGRPPRSPGEKLDQFSIRLTPKLKFGLELLARAQNRSLSQAVEWALQVGLNSYRINNDWENVAGLLDAVWASEDPFDRVNTIYGAAPNLLSFDDRAACEVVERSREWELAHEYLGTAKYATPLEVIDAVERREQIQKQRIEIFYNFVRSFWHMLRPAAIEHVTAGKSPENVNLMRLIGFAIPDIGIDEFARMQAYTELAKGTIEQKDVSVRVLELDSQFVWSRNRGKWNAEEIQRIAAAADESAG
jgi:hypothetical protein